MDKVGPYDLDSAILGDARDLAKAIPNGSVDLVFTDPSYRKVDVHMYGWLARMAFRVLKPGGFCLAMAGGLYLDRVMALMSHCLTWYWLYEIGHTGQRTGVVWPHGNRRVRIVAQVRPVLAYSKGKGLSRISTLGLFRGTGRDKRYHAYGQDEASTRYFVDCFSREGDVVLDPFCGGGTTAAMCVQLGRRFVTFDKDPEAIAATRERLTQVQPFLFNLQPDQMRVPWLEGL